MRSRWPCIIYSGSVLNISLLCYRMPGCRTNLYISIQDKEKTRFHNPKGTYFHVVIWYLPYFLIRSSDQYLPGGTCFKLSLHLWFDIISHWHSTIFLVSLWLSSDRPGSLQNLEGGLSKFSYKYYVEWLREAFIFHFAYDQVLTLRSAHSFIMSSLKVSVLVFCGFLSQVGIHSWRIFFTNK